MRSRSRLVEPGTAVSGVACAEFHGHVPVCCPGHPGHTLGCRASVDRERRRGAPGADWWIGEEPSMLEYFDPRGLLDARCRRVVACPGEGDGLGRSPDGTLRDWNARSSTAGRSPLTDSWCISLMPASDRSGTGSRSTIVVFIEADSVQTAAEHAERLPQLAASVRHSVRDRTRITQRQQIVQPALRERRLGTPTRTVGM